jgi:hypothetical protein
LQVADSDSGFERIFGEEEMRGIPFVRIACSSLAIPVASVISFPTLPSAIKGDKPPVVASEKQQRPQLQTYEKIPFGCDSPSARLLRRGG